MVNPIMNAIDDIPHPLTIHVDMLHSISIPASKPNSKHLMLVLHGLGDSAEGYRMFVEMLGIPGMNYLLVNAPDHYFGGYSWYEYEGDAKPGVERSRKLLAELLDQQREQGFASEHTFMFGFSQGCLMTLETGTKYSHKLAGCVGVSGYSHDPDALLTNLSPVAKEQEFLITHGTHDPVVPFDRTEAQIKRFREAGLQMDWHVFPKVHTIMGEEVTLIREFVTQRMAES